MRLPISSVTVLSPQLHFIEDGEGKHCQPIQPVCNGKDEDVSMSFHDFSSLGVQLYLERPNKRLMHFSFYFVLVFYEKKLEVPVTFSKDLFPFHTQTWKIGRASCRERVSSPV